MFDAETARLIAGAPALEGVDLAALPQDFTNAYAAIVAARLRLEAGSHSEQLPEDIAAIVSRMRRLAFTHEAMVAVSADRGNRTAAAFVAGSAHHIALMAEKLRHPEQRPSRLDYESISPEISATLLFLIAEASADAAEMARSIVVQTPDHVVAALLQSIDHLAHGRLQDILALPTPASESILVAEHGDQPTRALYFLILSGVRTLAAAMLGATSAVGGPASEPNAIFEQARSLCVEPMESPDGDSPSGPYSVYPGPLHLASLLSSAAMDLFSSALVNVTPPGGIDGGRWRSVMQEAAAHRPYLWRNHREAVAAGYLEPGASAAISFPTGAGKSTLSELKIAATLLRGMKVIFLAPTLALVDQTARTLTSSFPKADVLREREEELTFELKSDALPAVSVMTPERCLALLSFDRGIFMEIGLVVFDECHLLHPRENDRSRRAIDAMLCILNLTSIAPHADMLLLSAMMSNCAEIAAWVESLTGRRCLSLALTWKPTRQVRGCVVYGETEITALGNKLQQVRATGKTQHPPASLKRTLFANPFGFFCLRQTWQSQARRDYALLPLLKAPVTLSTGVSKKGKWYLTPNGNQVAATLAAACARQQLKTLVFTQTIPLANSAASAVEKMSGTAGTMLTDSEKRWHATAQDEAGGSERIYLRANTDGVLISSSACHHGLLLPSERLLHESLFKRPDGIAVLVATSTLAQGMNLPSEVVIIAGDSRFDPNANRVQQLEAHELLNAAGRAGRAGERAHGFVLVVPSKVVDFNDETSKIHNHWSDLQAIFAQSDQCLVIEDPFRSLLDQIHDASTPRSDLATYLIRRLPMGESTDEDPDSPTRKLLARSMAAYQARTRGDAAWIDARIEAVVLARRADPQAPAILTWVERLSAAAAVPPDFVRALSVPLSQTFDRNIPVLAWTQWMATWLKSIPQVIPLLVRRESLEGLFGAAYKELADDQARGQYVAPRLFELLDCWMRGDTLAPPG